MVKSTAVAVLVVALAAVSGFWIRSNIREAHLKRRLAAFGQRLGTPEWPSAETPPLQISLEQRFGRARFRSCDLKIELVERVGRSVLRCVWTITPARDLTSQRSLTSQETQQLLALTTGTEILSGTASGKDFASADGLTETVTIQRGAEITVLVASGNPTFETGSRRQLLNLLHSIIEELQRAGTQ